MSDLQGLPVSGYRPQSADKVNYVNLNKEFEEFLLRRMETLGAEGITDPRWVAIAKTHFEQGFMALNRAIFQPSRVKLPGE